MRENKQELQVETLPPFRGIFNKQKTKEFPGSPVVRTLSFHCRGHRFHPFVHVMVKQTAYILNEFQIQIFLLIVALFKSGHNLWWFRW